MITDKETTFECPVPDCPKTSKSRRGMNIHISAHKRRGELGGGKIEPSHPSPQPSPQSDGRPTPEDIADALLGRAVKAIESSELRDQQIKLANARIAALEQENDRLRVEKERLLKIHNDQVKARHLTTSDELLRLAGMERR